MADSHPHLLVGNSLAVLVAAHELVQRGRPVTLLTDGKPLGGHFAGLTLEGRAFDVGMVMLERPGVVPAASPAIDYHAARRNDWTRFAGDVAAWMDERIAPRRAPTPTVQAQGASGPDYLIANRLELLAGSGAGADAPPAADDARHARHKVDGAPYDTMSYAEAAALHHGADWHARWIEPFVHKLLDCGSDAFLARYHRAGWVPLFWPGTLDAARRGERTGLPEYPFHTTADGFVGGVAARLAAAVEAAPGSRLLRAPLQGLAFEAGRWQAWSEDGRFESATLALGLAPDRAHGLFGLPPLEPQRAASVVLLFALVRADAIGRPLGCHMVVDAPYAAYRLTDQDALAGLDPAWHRVVIEASPRLLAERAGSDDPAALQRVLADELRTLMVVEEPDALRPLKCLTARNALVLPTAQAVAAARYTPLALAQAVPGARLTGNLLGYGVASFNDQVVQGLQIAQDFLA